MSPQRRSAAERSTAVFEALRALLLEHPWGEVTLEAVARDAGVSRQTLYNAFGSRYGLAQAYTLALADLLCDAIEVTIAAHAEDPRRGLEQALLVYLETAATDPLIRRVRAGEAHHDLVRIVTTDAGPLLTRVAGRVEAAVRTSWPQVSPERAVLLARTVARLAVSFVTMPPEYPEYDESPAALAAGLAVVLAP